MLSAEVASVLAKFFDAGKGPSHDELSLLFRQAGLAAADPGPSGPAGPIGKMKRVRQVLFSAVQGNPDAGSRLVALLVDALRANGGFLPGSDVYPGDELVAALRRAFGSIGYELDPEGHLRPATLENLEGAQLTEALWAYIRRARAGSTDAPHVVGTSKDLAEAVARHIVVEMNGTYVPTMGFPGTLYQAFDLLGLTAVGPDFLGRLDSDGRVAMQQALYLLGCAVNRLRNQEGTGHGRPAQSRADERDARISAQVAGLVSELLLATLDDRQGGG